MAGMYHVLWEIDIEADSPVEAARKALAVQRNPHSTAAVFSVADADKGKRVIDITAAGAADDCDRA